MPVGDPDLVAFGAGVEVLGLRGHLQEIFPFGLQRPVLPAGALRALQLSEGVPTRADTTFILMDMLINLMPRSTADCS